MKCRVNEIYPCLIGESTATGLTSLLIRLSGCNLDCCYCDTKHAQLEPGTLMAIPDLVATVAASGHRRVLITGGEPLLQAQGVAALSSALLANGVDVFIETNGSLLLDSLPAGVKKIVDIKTPGSGAGGRFLPENLAHMRPWDQLKIVVTSEEDYRWAIDYLEALGPLPIAPENVLLSACNPGLDSATLAKWMIDGNVPYRLNVQLHRYLWGDSRGV